MGDDLITARKFVQAARVNLASIEAAMHHNPACQSGWFTPGQIDAALVALTNIQSHAKRVRARAVYICSQSLIALLNTPALSRCNQTRLHKRQQFSDRFISLTHLTKHYAQGLTDIQTQITGDLYPTNIADNVSRRESSGQDGSDQYVTSQTNPALNNSLKDKTLSEAINLPNQASAARSTLKSLIDYAALRDRHNLLTIMDHNAKLDATLKNSILENSASQNSTLKSSALKSSISTDINNIDQVKIDNVITEIAAETPLNNNAEINLSQKSADKTKTDSYRNSYGIGPNPQADLNPPTHSETHQTPHRLAERRSDLPLDYIIRDIIQNALATARIYNKTVSISYDAGDVAIAPEWRQSFTARLSHILNMVIIHSFNTSKTGHIDLNVEGDRLIIKTRRPAPRQLNPKIEYRNSPLGCEIFLSITPPTAQLDGAASGVIDPIKDKANSVKAPKSKPETPALAAKKPYFTKINHKQATLMPLGPASLANLEGFPAMDSLSIATNLNQDNEKQKRNNPIIAASLANGPDDDSFAHDSADALSERLDVKRFSPAETV